MAGCGSLDVARHGRSIMPVVDADSRNVSKGIFKAPKLNQFFDPKPQRYVKSLGEPDQDAALVDNLIHPGQSQCAVIFAVGCGG
jgi:hypothetical protein